MASTRSRILLPATLLAGLIPAGCGETQPPAAAPSGSGEVASTPTPAAEPAPAPEATQPAPIQPADRLAGSNRTEQASPNPDGVTLKRLRWDQFLSQVATNPDAKYTLVDAWATWCGPCKENFPHLVEMHRKYADKGLAVASLSFDDPEDADAVKEAEAFLREKGATFTNVLLDEDQGVGNDKLDINAIPAVFLYGPDGKEVKRYTMDDPDNQFTYDQVEKDVAGLLGVR